MQVWPRRPSNCELSKQDAQRLHTGTVGLGSARHCKRSNDGRRKSAKCLDLPIFRLAPLWSHFDCRAHVEIRHAISFCASTPSFLAIRDQHLHRASRTSPAGRATTISCRATNLVMKGDASQQDQVRCLGAAANPMLIIGVLVTPHILHPRGLL